LHNVHLDDDTPVIPFHPSLSHYVVYPADLQLYRRMALLGQCPKRRLAEEEANGIHWRVCELRSVTNRGIIRSTPELKIECDLYVLVVGRLRYSRLIYLTTCRATCPEIVLIGLAEEPALRSSLQQLDV